MVTNGKSVKKNTKGKDIEKKSSKISLTIKCYKCQGYGHIATNCSSPVRITIIDGTLTESDSEDNAY